MRVVGASGRLPLQIELIKAGNRTLALSHPQILIWECDFRVEPIVYTKSRPN